MNWFPAGKAFFRMGKEQKINYKFEEELKVLTNKSETMGIREQILDIAALDISLIRKYTGLSCGIKRPG